MKAETLKIGKIAITVRLETQHTGEDVTVEGSIVSGTFIGYAPPSLHSDTLVFIAMALRDHGFPGALVVPAAPLKADLPERDIRVRVTKPAP